MINYICLLFPYLYYFFIVKLTSIAIYIFGLILDAKHTYLRQLLHFYNAIHNLPYTYINSCLHFFRPAFTVTWPFWVKRGLWNPAWQTCPLGSPSQMWRGFSGSTPLWASYGQTLGPMLTECSGLRYFTFRGLNYIIESVLGRLIVTIIVNWSFQVESWIETLNQLWVDLLSQ